jgi:hypothetical protein
LVKAITMATFGLIPEILSNSSAFTFETPVALTIMFIALMTSSFLQFYFPLQNA